MGYAHPMELMQQGFQVPTWMRGQMMPQQMMVENQEPGEGDDESSSSTLGYSNMGWHTHRVIYSGRQASQTDFSKWVFDLSVGVCEGSVATQSMVTTEEVKWWQVFQKEGCQEKEEKWKDWEENQEEDWEVKRQEW